MTDTGLSNIWNVNLKCLASVGSVGGRIIAFNGQQPWCSVPTFMWFKLAIGLLFIYSFTPFFFFDSSRESKMEELKKWKIKKKNKNKQIFASFSILSFTLILVRLSNSLCHSLVGGIFCQQHNWTNKHKFIHLLLILVIPRKYLSNFVLNSGHQARVRVHSTMPVQCSIPISCHFAATRLIESFCELNYLSVSYISKCHRSDENSSIIVVHGWDQHSKIIMVIDGLA